MTAASTPREEDLIRLMANAAWNGPSELKITHNQYDGIAKKMLAALSEAGWEVARLEAVGIELANGALAPLGRYKWDPDNVTFVYRKLLPQEEADG